MSEPVGLRERKRRATRRSIQMSVLALIQDKGLDRVTIEEISARADVSPRTFFNYFPSKEAAAVGDAPELHPSDALDEFVDGGWGGGLIADVARLLTTAVQSADDDVVMITERRRILREYPHLFAMRMQTMQRFEEDLTALVARRLEHDGGAVGGESIPDRARLVTLVSFGALRHAWGRWADSDGSVPLADLIELSFDGLARLLDEQRVAVEPR